MGWPSGAASPSSCRTGFGYTYRWPLVAPATNADFTGSVAFRNATVPVSIVPSRLTLALNVPSSTEAAGRSVASTRSSTVPGVSGPHDEEPSTTRGVTLLASTVPAASRSVTRARMGERDRDIECSSREDVRRASAAVAEATIQFGGDPLQRGGAGRRRTQIANHP